MTEDTPSLVTRREAIRRATVIAGGVALAGSGALVACTAEKMKPNASSAALDDDDRALAEAIADTLLPDTPASPGARAAGAGAAIDLLVTDCYDDDARKKLVRGLGEFRSFCRTRCGSGFAALPQPDRERLLREVDAEAEKAGKEHWFHLVRELSQRAYFSSEVGMTKALRWVMVPGRWEGCVPLAPGQHAWA